MTNTRASGGLAVLMNMLVLAPLLPLAASYAATDPTRSVSSVVATDSATPLDTTATADVAANGELVATVRSSKSEYAPGDTVTQSGLDWVGDTAVRLIDTLTFPTPFIARVGIGVTGIDTARLASTIFTEVELGLVAIGSDAPD